MTNYNELSREELLAALKAAQERITSLEARESALEEREETLHALLNAMPDIVCFKDGEGRWLHANAADLRLFGLQGVDYHGKTDCELADETLPLYREAFLNCEDTDEKAWREGRLSRVEEAIPRPDGSHRVFDVIKLPLFREDGSRKGLLVLGRDITERKRAEDALQESERRQSLFLQGANDGLWDWDRKTDEVFFSARWKEIIGYQDHELENKLDSWVSNIHPEDTERVLQANNQFYEGQDTHFEVEYRMRHKDGGYRWILGRGTCQRDDEGVPVRMAGAHTDITRLKRAEERLRESMQRLDFHVKNSPLAAIEWKDGTHIANWSSQAEAMFGWSADEVMGNSWEDFAFIHPEDAPVVAGQVVRLFEGREIFNTCRNRNLRKDGSVVHCHWFNSALRDESGRMIRILSLVADVTELVQTAAELEKAKEDAEAASLAKSQFLAAMSHEIRTPMNAIVGMAELLRDTPLNQEQRQYLHIFEAASDSLLTLLGDILDISKVEAGQLQLERIPFPLRAVVDTVCKVLGSRASEKGLELAVNISPDVPPVLVGDPTRLRQVLINLVGNAVKFTHAGEVVIEFAAEESSGEEGVVSLLCSVRDTGIGIKPRNIGKIFERFTQGDSSITREYGGSGLGLAISKSLVELMGGRIWVESREGLGSVFYFTAGFGMPTRNEEAQTLAEGFGDDLSSLSQPVDCPAPKPSGNPLRVLLVEDSEYNAFVVLAYLKDMDCAIDIAKNGLEGFDFFKSKPYDLVLMDMRMPLMDGYTASKAIRQWERESGAKPVPIIAMTAQAFKEDRQRSLDAGCDLHLAKPIRKQELLDALSCLAPARPVPSRPVPSRPDPAGDGVDATCPEGEDMANYLADSAEYPAEGPIVVELDPDFSEIAPRYLESLGQTLKDLRCCVGEGKTEPLCRMGHQMKGEGKAFGFAPVSQMGLTLQQAGECCDMERACKVLNSLEDYLARVAFKGNG